MRRAVLTGSVAGLVAACNHPVDEEGDGSASDGPEFCATDPEVDGAWVQEFEDWNDPGPEGLEILSDDMPQNGIVDLCDGLTQDAEAAPSQIAAHHCFTTAVHAVHMRTRDILMHHGQDDERVWRIGEDPEAIGWHPVPFNARTNSGTGPRGTPLQPKRPISSAPGMCSWQMGVYSLPEGTSPAARGMAGSPRPFYSTQRTPVPPLIRVQCAHSGGRSRTNQGHGRTYLRE